MSRRSADPRPPAGTVWCECQRVEDDCQLTVVIGEDEYLRLAVRGYVVHPSHVRAEHDTVLEVGEGWVLVGTATGVAPPHAAEYEERLEGDPDA